MQLLLNDTYSTSGCVNPTSVQGQRIFDGAQYIYATHVLQLYCHYMPNLEGAETMKELGLPPNVRWLPFWKGRLMLYPDLTAL